MHEVVLKIICGSCEQWLLRYTVDSDRPFEQCCSAAADGELVVDPTVRTPQTLVTESPGGYIRTGNGPWERWVPGPYAHLPSGETTVRYTFACGSPGCRTNYQALALGFDRAVIRVLKHLHGAPEKKLSTTVTKLLGYAQ